MALLNYCCFVGKKKRVKANRRSAVSAEHIDVLRSLHEKVDHPVKSSENVELNSTSINVSVPLNNFPENSGGEVKVVSPVKGKPEESNSTFFSVSKPIDIPENSSCEMKVMNPENPVEREGEEVAYEGEDEHDDKSPTRNDNSNSNFGKEDCLLERTKVDRNGGEDEHDDKSPTRNDNSNSNFGEEDCLLERTEVDRDEGSSLEDCLLDRTEVDRNEGSSLEMVNEHSVNKSEKDANVERVIEVTAQEGHISDPEMMDREEQGVSRELQRSCSSLETREVLKKIAYEKPPSKSKSFEELHELAEKVKEDVGSPRSQSSALSHYSADKVMLKRHSLSQVLPSRSRKIWWKLFIWSHRNLQKPSDTKPKVSELEPVKQQGGYTSDTLEPSQVKDLSKLESHKSGHEENDAQECDELMIGAFGLCPQNQWAAFSWETSLLKRVDDWVNDLEVQSTTSSADGENDNTEEVIFPPSPEVNKSMVQSTNLPSSSHTKVSLSKELLHANTVIQTLGSSSTVAHMSGMGLRVVPMISQFSRLRSVNLSNNNIVQIPSGSLPKGLHTLDLSRNKICTIVGLRELTRLRVLDLSYNRISRLGHGVANCGLLKELYLAGNKISEIEGLHRLHKLTVLDLSFNKITTKKAMGQIVANYSSLLTLNLLENPIQKNLSEEQLRKAICGFLPKLAYLNKQAVNQQKARDVSKEILRKTTPRSNSLSVRRRLPKKTSQIGSRLTGSKSSLGILQKSRSKSKSRSNKESGLKISAQ